MTRGLLGSLTGRCSALKTLTLCKVGDRTAEDMEPFAAQQMERSYLLREWTGFTNSVRSTLEIFIFEHGPPPLRLSSLGVHPVRNMDSQFGELVSPTFIAEPWPWEGGRAEGYVDCG